MTDIEALAARLENQFSVTDDDFLAARLLRQYAALEEAVENDYACDCNGVGHRGDCPGTRIYAALDALREKVDD